MPFTRCIPILTLSLATFFASAQTTTAAPQQQLNKLTPVTDATLRHPPAADWLLWRRTYDSLGFSPLRQINRRNVATLITAWTHPLAPSLDEITPLVHDGVLFIQSANQVQAIDGASGDVLWTYTRTLPDSLHNGRYTSVKNLALYQDKLFCPMPDGHLVALDMHSGKVLWDQIIITPEEAAGGAHVSGGPLVANGNVIVGVTFCITYKGGCFILGLDAQTGRQNWRFNTIARPGQPGGDSWNGAPVDQRFGASVWTAGSFDPDLDLVYFGTGQTYDTATLLQPHPDKGNSNNALYTDSTVALNPATGKLAWYYQHMARDVWDLDWAFEQSLINLPVNGKTRKLVVTGGKIAIFDALDRTNGQYLFSKDLGLQNIVTAIDPKSGHKTISDALTPVANQTKLLCPSADGARNWPATAYNPATKILYIPITESCTQFTWRPRNANQTIAGGADIHFADQPRPGSNGNFGRVEAINLQTKQVLWIDHLQAPTAGSMLATAGGLVFNGARDRNFRAYDAANGKLLWHTTLNAVPSSTPITYSVNGVQYIAVVTGGGGAYDARSQALTHQPYNPTTATTLWVFKLPQSKTGSTLFLKQKIRVPHPSPPLAKGG